MSKSRESFISLNLLNIHMLYAKIYKNDWEAFLHEITIKGLDAYLKVLIFISWTRPSLLRIFPSLSLTSLQPNIYNLRKYIISLSVEVWFLFMVSFKIYRDPNNIY